MKLTAHAIVKQYGRRKVVDEVGFEVGTGEVVGLLGPNGAGKTTSFYMVTGLVQPDGGSVTLLDDEGITHDLTREPMYRRAQRGIGYLPQEASVFRKLSVEDNILAVLELHRPDPADRTARLEELLEEFGLTHVRKNRGDVLSGGEKRRTEIARALAADPRFILLDEPLNERWPHDSPLESVEQLDERVDAARRWLQARDESCIAVVGHGAFLRRLMFGRDQGEGAKPFLPHATPVRWEL